MNGKKIKKILINARVDIPKDVDVPKEKPGG